MNGDNPDDIDDPGPLQPPIPAPQGPFDDPLVLPSMYGDAFRYLQFATAGQRIHHMSLVDKVNGYQRLQQRVIIITDTNLFVCHSDGSIKRSIALDTISELVLFEVEPGGNAPPRAALAAVVPCHYDVLLLPRGDDGERGGAEYLPQLAKALVEASTVAEMTRPRTSGKLRVTRLGRYAGEATPALSLADTAVRFRLRKPEKWSAPEVVLSGSFGCKESPTVSKDTGLLINNEDSSDSDTTIVDVVCISATAENRDPFVRSRPSPTPSDADGVPSDDGTPARATSTGPSSRLAQTVWSQNEESPSFQLQRENEELRQRVEALETEVAFWRTKFLSARDTGSAPGSPSRHSNHDRSLGDHADVFHV